MSTEGSITELIDPAKQGDELAFAKLHARYAPLVINRARKKLGIAPLRSVDPDDVAQEAFLDCFRALRDGNLPDVVNRGQLLAFLTCVVTRKAVNVIVAATRQKHDGRRNVYPDALDALLQDRRPGPEQEAIARDCVGFYLGRIPQQLREVAELQLAGMDKHQIAAEIGRSVRAVERKLKILREQWHDLIADSVDRDVSELLPENHEESG